MNVVVVIDGKEAIPVRAIPFLTNWETMSPDAIARALARHERFFRFETLQSYVKEEEKLRVLEATWWENFVCRQLDALSDSIEATQITHEVGYQIWRQKSIAILPAGSFVWKDEYCPLHAIEHGRYGTTFIKSSGDVMTEEEQQKRMTLNFDPFIPEIETRKLIMEGFEVQDLAAKSKPATLDSNQLKPWQIQDTNDPEPLQAWYTPARYFARQLVIADSTLLSKKLILAERVSISLSNVGIYKRGGKKMRHNASTVLKAFANTTLG
ncbi:MAG TPA: hypothetical protein PK702_04425 [Burkholderiaceae bacterium]|nr:hypothetical protein [Burkholderiaceae bacterium]